MITISKHSKRGKTCSNYSLSQHKSTQNYQPGAWSSVHCASSVLVERFLPSRFNKLPYVSICSTTGESELTFQSAGACASWMHDPKFLPQLHLSRLTTGWQSEGRPSSPRNTPLLLSTPSSASSHRPPPPSLLQTKPSRVSPQSVAPLLSFLLLEVQGLAPFNLRNNRQGSPAGGSTDFSAGCLEDVKGRFGMCGGYVCVYGGLPAASSFQFQDKIF